MLAELLLCIVNAQKFRQNQAHYLFSRLSHSSISHGTFRLHELRNKERISVAAASKLLNNMVYSYKGMGLSMVSCPTILCATATYHRMVLTDMNFRLGDHGDGGPGLFYVDSDGSRVKGDLFSVGSGSTFAYGVLDSEYHYDLDAVDACELGRRAIYHATHRDAYSGGTVNVYHMKETGWEFKGNWDVSDLHYEYQDMAKTRLA
ncbi:MAG: nucleophile aminohydrolase [Olpidium bornovanus]|uniref:proteasome endopeptidase complex n=1 Tax=Olpidium bornovanus TaxID=278681 RepID=A0A8H8A1Q2_9FUNG|nr:MAG: nucleophile aminohydrolase [Olpidium bornovanus]